MQTDRSPLVAVAFAVALVAAFVLAVLSPDANAATAPSRLVGPSATTSPA